MNAEMTVGEAVKPVTSDHTYTVLACRPKHQNTEGAHDEWVVLCHLPHNAFHPFAIWRAYATPEGWAFANGDYHRDLPTAVNAYTNR